ncbi:MAG: starch-binding protein [Ruminococcus sp.]|nr:starch-binding protein [Ruminococcus sp.]
MRKNIKRFCAAAVTTAVLLTQTLTGGLAAMAAEKNTGADLLQNGLSETVEGGAILHCWCWDFNTIRENIPEIAAAGFSAIQTSPICEVNNGGDGSLTISGGDNWWWHYQPTDYKIGNYQFGTKDEFKAMCDTAHQYGVKVIVDSVLNHTTAYYDKISDNIKNLPGGAFHPMGDEREEGQNWSEVDRYEETQYDLSGLYELNTQNKAVQQYILDFLKDCVENGADGFRYDAAKLIELPDDTSEKYGNDFASDFWPTILQNGSSFQYGEVLQEGGRHTYANAADGYDDDDSSRLYAYHSQTYTGKDGAEHHMNTTNSYTGFRVRDAIANKNLDADFITDALLPAGANAEQTVTWVESHDNYCNDASYKELTETQQVIQAWAAIAARKDGTPLFFDRPNNSTASSPWGDNKIGPAGSDMFKDPQVVAVNFFRNEMGDTAQTACNPIEGNTQVVMIERGDSNKGVVIINASDEDVSLSASTGMADGAYTDQAYGGAFSVSDGVLSGTVKAGKVAVVYNPAVAAEDKVDFAPAVTLSVGSGYFLTDTLSVEVTVRSCDHASYELTTGGNTITGTAATGDIILVDGVANKDSAVLTLTGYDKDNQVVAATTKTYTKWIPQNNTVVYMEKEARDEWKNCYVYIWGTSENASWPGVKAELTAQGLYRYILPYPYEMDGSLGNVIFNSGSGQQFDAGQIKPGQQMVYTADGKWVAYSEDVYSQPSVALSKKTGYVTPDTGVRAIIKNCAKAAYEVVYNGDIDHSLIGEIENGDMIPLDRLSYQTEAVVTLIGCDENGNTIASATETYTGWVPQGNTVIYMDQAAKAAWKNCNAYIWGSSENASWPGVQMEKLDNDVYKLVLPYQYEIPGSYGNVIFNNGSGQQFDAGAIHPGEKMIYTADGKWIPYEEPRERLMGDVNDDGKVDIADASLIQRASIDLEAFTDAQNTLADVNEDGKVSILDVTCVQKYIAEFADGTGITGRSVTL